MAEAGAPATDKETPAVVDTPPVDTAAVETHEDDDKEPGGNSPQEIRARKEYRLRKRLEADLFDLQQQRAVEQAATNARLKTLEEVTRPPEKKEPVYTTAQLQAAVDAGTISVVEAADYLANQRAKQTADRVLQQERIRDDEQTRLNRAQEQIDKYVEIVPWLNDKRDSRRGPLEAEFARLVDPNGFYRLPPNVVTEALLLEKTFGSLETLRAKVRLDKTAHTSADVHVESGAGGNPPVSRPADGKVDLAKMPAHFHDYWNKSGTPMKEREKEAAIYFRNRQAKK